MKNCNFNMKLDVIINHKKIDCYLSFSIQDFLMHQNHSASLNVYEGFVTKRPG